MDALAAGLSAGRVRPLDDEKEIAPAEATRGQDEPVEWAEVAATMGTPNAVIIAGRLETHNIPTRVTQEAAGRVYAINVGVLGTAHVWVPQEFAEQAEEILAVDWGEGEE